MWIEGAEVAGDGAVEVVRNPATEEPIAEVASASPAQVDAAVAAARAALRGWRRTPAGERGELLHAVAAWLREHTEELGRLMTLEGGKPLVENTDEVGWTANAFAYYAELGRHERGRVIPSIEEGQLSLVLKEPVGVVAAIVPWNYPLLLLAWKLAPALAAGNTAVVKPSPDTPLSTLRLAEAFAGFPGGVVNLLAGGADAGEALVTHRGTDMVAFTGSVATGQRIGALRAEQVKRTHLELGGKDAFIVCDDVDLAVAAPGAAWAAYLNAGERGLRSTVTSDLIAFRDPVVLVLRKPRSVCTSASASTCWSRCSRSSWSGWWRRPGGCGSATRRSPPPTSARWWARCSAPRSSANWTRPLPRVPGCWPAATAAASSAAGSWRPPWWSTSTTPWSCCAPRRSGRWRRCSGSARWTRAARAFPRRPPGSPQGSRGLGNARASLTDNDAGPFGGMKMSGNARELGPEGLESFRETKHVHLDGRMNRKPWWYPYGRES
jgi:betaine-aldehyde dehydrogenase